MNNIYQYGTNLNHHMFHICVFQDFFEYVLCVFWLKAQYMNNFKPKKMENINHLYKNFQDGKNIDKYYSFYYKLNLVTYFNGEIKHK